MRVNFPTVILFLTAALSVSSAIAEVELNPNPPQTYTVRSGDNLWDIAGRFLRDPWRWSEIWESNREIGNPDLIYPGDVLELSYRNGQPRVGLRGGLRTVKLSPRVRVTPLKIPVPTIPLGSIQPFLTRPYVLDKAQIDAAPYVVDFPEEHLVAGLNDSVYVRSIYGEEGGRYNIVRPGEPYKDPESGQVLGYKALFVADAILERPGDPAKVTIATMGMETGIGDRVLSAAEDEPFTSFLPRPAPRSTKARIISVLNGVTQIGQFNVVVLNRGSRDGLQPGHVLDVYNGGQERRDQVRADSTGWNWKDQKFWSQETWYGEHRVQGWLYDEVDPREPLPPHVDVRKPSDTFIRPYEQAGTLMVFRTFPQVSFALVLSAARPMHVMDTVRSPET
jgi:hypothetical protein